MSRRAQLPRPRDRVTERIYAEGQWTATSALHVGGEAVDLSEKVDMTLLRDDNGNVFIPGASIAGAARSFLAKQLTDGPTPSHEQEPAALQALFGGSASPARTKPAFQSLMTVDDACIDNEEECVPYVRDGVKIDSVRGSAVAGAKFNAEVVPAETKFKLRFALLLYEEPPLGVAQADLFAYLRALLGAFSDEEISLGARTARGWGQGKVENWRVYRLMMDDRRHVAAWLARNWSKSIEPVSAESLSDRRLPHLRRWFSIEVTLRLKTSLLIRSAGEGGRSPEMTQLTERERSVVPGSSLAGALRSRCERIAKTIAPRKMEGEAAGLIDRMFGPSPEEEDGKKPSLSGSRVWVTERALSNGYLAVQGRATIDRFTGGTVDGRLFDQAPFWPLKSGESQLSTRIRLEDPSEEEVALLLLALKDLWLGDLPIGGEVGVGRGVFLGVEASIGHPDVANKLTLTSPDPGDPSLIERTGSDESWKQLDEMVGALHIRLGGERDAS